MRRLPELLLKIKLDRSELLDIVHLHLVKKLGLIDATLNFNWIVDVNLQTGKITNLYLEADVKEEV